MHRIVLTTSLVVMAVPALGLDVVVSRRWAVRALQVEGRKILASGAPSELVISAGAVFRFGSRPQSK